MRSTVSTSPAHNGACPPPPGVAHPPHSAYHMEPARVPSVQWHGSAATFDCYRGSPVMGRFWPGIEPTTWSRTRAVSELNQPGFLPAELSRPVVDTVVGLVHFHHNYEVVQYMTIRKSWSASDIQPPSFGRLVIMRSSICVKNIQSGWQVCH